MTRRRRARLPQLGRDCGRLQNLVGQLARAVRVLRQDIEDVKDELELQRHAVNLLHAKEQNDEET